MEIDMKNYRTDIEAVKLSLQTASRLGKEIEMTVLSSIGRLVEYYEASQEEEYLIGALLQIQAYLELGFAYERHRGLFNNILRKGGLERENIFTEGIWGAKEIKKNRIQVRSMLTKWSNPRGQGMCIAEVVNDILMRLEAGKHGTFFYRNHIGSEQEEIYELVIGKEECYFHDIRREKYYTFREKKYMIPSAKK